MPVVSFPDTDAVVARSIATPRGGGRKFAVITSQKKAFKRGREGKEGGARKAQPPLYTMKSLRKAWHTTEML